MCQECFRAVYRWFPELPSSEYHYILWNFTAYPSGGPIQIEEQLQELRDLTEEYGWKFARQIVYKEWDVVYDKFRAEQAGREWNPFEH